MITAEHLILKKTTEEDIPELLKIEAEPCNMDGYWMESEDEYRLDIKDPNVLILTAWSRSAGEIMGYIIADIDMEYNLFEIRRNVMADAYREYYAEATSEILMYAYVEKKYNVIL